MDPVQRVLDRLQLQASRHHIKRFRRARAQDLTRQVNKLKGNWSAIDATVKQHNRRTAQEASMMTKIALHEEALAPPEPVTPEQKNRVRHLHMRGMSETQIHILTNLTPDQARYAVLAHETETLPLERVPILNHLQETVLIRLVTSSEANRRMPVAAIPFKFGWDCPTYTINLALRRNGYERYPAIVRPEITEPIRVARLAWAQDHINWTVEQWKSVIWAANTCIRNGRETRVWVTRKDDEARHADCMIDNERLNQQGRMLWGSFSGVKGKGPCVLWESKWGPINQRNHSQHVFPAMHKWFSQHQNTTKLCIPARPALHDLPATQFELTHHGMEYIQLPLASPDLDLMSCAWDLFKTKVEYDRVFESLAGRGAMEDARIAWDSLKEADLMKLIESMPARCQAVITANGLYTPYHYN